MSVILAVYVYSILYSDVVHFPRPTTVISCPTRSTDLLIDHFPALNDSLVLWNAIRHRRTSFFCSHDSNECETRTRNRRP